MTKKKPVEAVEPLTESLPKLSFGENAVKFSQEDVEDVKAIKQHGAQLIDALYNLDAKKHKGAIDDVVALISKAGK